MRALVGCPGGRVLISAPCPDRWGGMIIPEPPPLWWDTARAALADFLSVTAEDRLQERGCPVGVDVVLTRDGPESAVVLWDDVEGTAEQTGALIAAVVAVCHEVAEHGWRYAKRCADREPAFAGELVGAGKA